MSRLQGDYGNLVHGVSNQPDERKFKGQCREQINCRSNLMKGLERRAGFVYVGDLLSDGVDLTGAKWVSQERGDGDAFITAYANDTPVIFDLNAITQTFAFDTQAVADYYTSDGGNDKSYGVSSVLDTTYITNRNVIPTGDDDVDEPTDLTAIFYVQFNTMGQGTQIEIDTATGANNDYNATVFDGFVSVTDGVPDPTQSIRTREYSGAYHAEAWASNRAGVTSFNNWARVIGSAKCTIVLGGDKLSLLDARSIFAVELLPPYAHDGDIVEIQEGAGEDANKGWFQAESNDGSTGVMAEVKWIEVSAPGSTGVLHANTMPHRINRDSAGDFTMVAIDWDERLVGYGDTNPYPSFITNEVPIEAIGLFQNRVFLAGGEIIHFSATEYYEDFWNSSAFYNTDSDPFEVYADTDELNIIKFAEQFDGDLIFFSRNGQFSLSGAETHTYKSSLIQSVSQYKSDLTGNPVLAGDNIYFATNYGNYAGVREYYTESITATKRARPVTDHVQDYIGGAISHMATSSNLDVLIALADDKTDAFLYEWRWQEQTKAQSSWGKWRLEHGFQFEWVGFIGSELFAVVSHEILGYQLWSMKWDDPIVLGLNFPVRLDGRFAVTGVTYDANTGMSSWTTSGFGYDADDLLFVEGPESEDPGFVVGYTKTAPHAYECEGDIAGVTLIAGLTYETSYSIPSPVMRDSEGVAMGWERLQLSQLALHFSSVGQVEFEIADDRDRVRTLNYNNRRMGNLDNRVSYVNIAESSWTIPVRKRSTSVDLRLFTSDITPFVLRGIEWFGEFKQKGKRV